jgi:Flp pilus assembly protein TadD
METGTVSEISTTDKEDFMAEIERTGKAKELLDQAFEAWFGNSSEGIDPNYAKAITLYSEVIKLMPDDTRGYSGRALCYRERGQMENAIADCNKVISLAPQDRAGYSSRAVVYVALSEMEKAKADLKKALELSPEEAGTSYYLFGDAIERYTGNKSEAAAYLRKVESGDFYGGAKQKLAKWGM